MYLKYGNYRHADNEVAVTIAKEGLFTQAGMPRGVRERWNLQGRLHAADQAGAGAAHRCAVCRLQHSGPGPGVLPGHRRAREPRDSFSAATNGGVRVVSPPSFPEGKGAEYSTFRSYTIALEAELLDPNATVLNWNETVSFSGGGPQFGFFEPIDGLPQKQLLSGSARPFARRNRARPWARFTIPRLRRRCGPRPSTCRGARSATTCRSEWVRRVRPLTRNIKRQLVVSIRRRGAVGRIAHPLAQLTIRKLTD